jgi:hypothetical protein
MSQQLQARHKMPQQLGRLKSVVGEVKMNTAVGRLAAAPKERRTIEVVDEMRGIILKRQDAIHPATAIQQQQVSLQEEPSTPFPQQQQQLPNEEEDEEEIEIVEVEYPPHSPLSTPPPTPPYVHKKFNNPPNSPVLHHHSFPKGTEPTPANNKEHPQKQPPPRLNSIAEILDDLSGPSPQTSMKDAWASSNSRDTTTNQDPRSGAKGDSNSAADTQQKGHKRSTVESEQIVDDSKRIRTFSRQVPILFNILRQNASWLVSERRRSFYQARFIFKPFRNEYALAGFYYTGFGDSCTCFASGCFARVDNHAEAWLKHSERCAFLLVAAPSHSQSPIEEIKKRDINFDDPSYYYVRLRSFDGMQVRGNPAWFSPSKMAEAGFIRNGERRIECFACHTQFVDDQIEDIVCARAAHRKWNSGCPYLKMTG